MDITQSRDLGDFDIRPHPRIYPMLGEINLAQWRCLAELIDNSIDAFVATKRHGFPVSSPEVHISVPMTDVPEAKITVRDNGPGMNPETLENAVRAGWTGNDPINNLGMFGMGFNIATARLGSVTQVWTTQKGDSDWCGLEIDFDKLGRQRDFRTPRLTRPKVDRETQGTEIKILRLKPEQRLWFTRAANRSQLMKDLERTYSSMLRTNGVPLSFRLLLGTTQVQGRNHCIWGGEGNPTRLVHTARYGQVSAYQPVDVKLADRLFCVKCWQWVPLGEQNCPACGSSEDIVVRQRRVYGWLGVQRYLSSKEYGVDFLRHGRKIEVANRDLFFWDEEEEYPIDDPRHRARIVGEIHLDHCRVTYMKDRFDRNDPAWDEMVQIVRGGGPLRPEKAEQAGFAPNNSPLFLLYQVFRRSSPKPKVAGSYARLLIVPDNDRAEEMARRFYARETEYQTDTKWWELVEEEDRKLLTPSSASNSGTDDGLDGFGLQPDAIGQRATSGTNSSDTLSPTTLSPNLTPVLPRRVPVAALTHEYREDATSVRWAIEAYEVDSTDPGLGSTTVPWVLKAKNARTFEFLVNSKHTIFRSATMTSLDALLAEMAASAVDLLRGTPTVMPFSVMLANLRDRYAAITSLDPVALSQEARTVLSDIARSLNRNASAEDSLALFNELSSEEQATILRRATVADRDPRKIIDEARFLDLAPRQTLVRFFERHPELFFDGRFWDDSYATLDYNLPSATEEARLQRVRYFAGLLMDAVWLAEQDATDLAEASRDRLLRASLALDLLATSAQPASTP